MLFVFISYKSQTALCVAGMYHVPAPVEQCAQRDAQAGSSQGPARPQQRPHLCLHRQAQSSRGKPPRPPTVPSVRRRLHA
jgi:hypothetical protein